MRGPEIPVRRRPQKNVAPRACNPAACRVTLVAQIRDIVSLDAVELRLEGQGAGLTDVETNSSHPLKNTWT